MASEWSELAEAKKAQQVAVDACWEAAGERDDLKVQLTAANARIQELTCKVAPPTEETPLPHGETPADREAAKFLRQSFNGPPSEQAETFSRQLCMTVRILSLRDHELRAALRRAETAEAVLNSLSNYEPNTVLEIIDSALSFTKPLSSTGAQSQPQQEGKTSMSEAPKCICGATKERKFFMGGYPPIWRCKACEYAAAPPSTQQPEGEK